MQILCAGRLNTSKEIARYRELSLAILEEIDSNMEKEARDQHKILKMKCLQSENAKLIHTKFLTYQRKL